MLRLRRIGTCQKHHIEGVEKELLALLSALGGSHRSHERAAKRKKEAGKRPRLKNGLTVSYVCTRLKLGWSPEQIAGRIDIDHPGLSISHEAVYQYIYHPRTEGRDELIGHLRRGHRKRKRKGVGRKERKGKIPNRIPIEERPASADQSASGGFGHWEGDSLVSRKSLAALSTLVERKSRLLFLTKLERKSAVHASGSVIRRLQGFPEGARRTLTLDNGTENARHQEITEAIGPPQAGYFASPYASWQRGTNEHMNGLVRWYFPKGTNFGKITDESALGGARVESLINNRPRKCLGYKTPLEVASSFVALRA